MPEQEKEQSTVAHFKYDGEAYSVDFSDLEFDEIGAVEDLTGKDLQDLNWFSARGLQGLVWIAMHRRNPAFTIELAGKLKIGKVDMQDEPEDETPAKRPPTKRAPAAAKSGGN